MEKMNFVIVGYGGMGGYHARELIGENDYVQTYGVYDIKEERREQARKDGFQTYDTLNDVLADDDVEAILIATPNDSHHEIAIKSLRAGKHVVCEKPVTMSVAELDDILAVAETTQRQFMVHQNRRWDNDFNCSSGINNICLGKSFKLNHVYMEQMGYLEIGVI